METSKRWKRSFRELKKTMEERELLELCKKIATEYANSPEEYARSYFMNKYDIKESCFYKCLEVAIIKNLITEELIEKMERKSINNQKVHDTTAGAKTHLKYYKMRKERDLYIFSQFSDDEIEKVAIEFSYSKMSKGEFAKEKEISKRVLELLLKKAIEEAIVEDIIVYAIKERSITNAKNPKQVEEFFKELIKKRNEKISELLSE